VPCLRSSIHVSKAPTSGIHDSRTLLVPAINQKSVFARIQSGLWITMSISVSQMPSVPPTRLKSMINRNGVFDDSFTILFVIGGGTVNAGERPNLVSHLPMLHVFADWGATAAKPTRLTSSLREGMRDCTRCFQSRTDVLARPAINILHRAVIRSKVSAYARITRLRYQKPRSSFSTESARYRGRPSGKKPVSPRSVFDWDIASQAQRTP